MHTRLLIYLASLLCLLFAFPIELEAKKAKKKSLLPGINPTLARPLQPLPSKDIIKKVEYQGLIVIDPGHGGHDMGTHSLKKNPKYQEKHLTLAMSRMLRDYLQNLGYKVALTRNSDEFISLEDRATFANDKEAKLFVSIHFNSAPNREAEGIEIFYHRSDTNKKKSSASKNLAQTILKKTLQTTGASSRGVKHGNLSVTKHTTMPAVLIEGGFLTNEEEALKIKSAAYLKKLAWGIAQGIQEYLSNEKNK